MLRLRSSFQDFDVAVFHDFVPPPSGGGHQFLRTLIGEFERRGLKVEINTISRSTVACLFNSFNYDAERLQALRRPTCRLVHRVDGPVGIYRGHDDGTDAAIEAANAAFADATVFQSEYSAAAHRDLGLTFQYPTIIHNASDPQLFFPAEGIGTRMSPAGRLRLIASAWSDNPNKGLETFRWLDANLDWERFEMTFVGRVQEVFVNIEMAPPVDQHELAALLRSHHVYVCASRHEPCSNALIEALSCGLPALYLESGSNGELVGRGGLGFATPEDIPGALEQLSQQYDRFRGAVAPPTIGDVADRYLEVLGITP